MPKILSRTTPTSISAHPLLMVTRPLNPAVETIILCRTCMDKATFRIIQKVVANR